VAVIACTADDIGVRDECCCCGGWIYAAGNKESIVGSVPSLRYCSIECHDDWEDFLAEQKQHFDAAWCPTCGYDRHEHAPDCADHLGALAEPDALWPLRTATR
jgi:hypothetical protein